MVVAVLSWGLNNPLQWVAGLAVGAILVGLLLVPRLHEISRHGHPRC